MSWMDSLYTDVASANVLVMFAAALSQWAVLDGSLAALLAASITSVGGPLSELPFVANGFWHYLPQAGDYLPLANVPQYRLVMHLLGYLETIIETWRYPALLVHVTLQLQWMLLLLVDGLILSDDDDDR